MVQNERNEFFVLKSKIDKLQKAVFLEKGIEKFYSVSFYVEEEKDCVICVSSQIGCPENCKFCATGEQLYVRNLSKEEIVQEILIGISMIEEMLDNTEDKQVSVIFEGMGEASYNIENCFIAFDNVYYILAEKFNNVVFRISSVGNILLCHKYKEYFQERKDKYQKVSFQCKLSLHTIFQNERLYLTPNISKKSDINVVLDEFCELSKLLGTKLICNYVLFKYPNGECNYTKKHLIKLGNMIDRNHMKILLGVYSETDKGFISPQEREYNLFSYYLKEKCKIETNIIKLYGSDINAACGMLNYGG